MTEALYQYSLPAGGHWSFRVRRGLRMRLTDKSGGANVGMLFYNPNDFGERYNAPDTLKCQHTFKLTRGHCLYSDMGRVFCSVVEDSVGWHETVCGNSTAKSVAEIFGERNYQTQSNQWHQNGYDGFLVELAKYGLGARDMAANINWFSKVTVDELGGMKLDSTNSVAGSSVELRFEMDSLVVMHGCPHPLNTSSIYPQNTVDIELLPAQPIADDDFCKNSCAENQRGFRNNELYFLGGGI